MRHFQHGKKEVGYRQYCLNEYFISFALCISSILFACNLYIKKNKKKVNDQRKSNIGHLHRDKWALCLANMIAFPFGLSGTATEDLESV